MLNLGFFVFLFGVTAGVDLSGCRPREPKVIDATTQFTGEVTSPGFNEGEDYPDDIFCQYTISGAEGYRIKLIFDYVDIEQHDFCIRDFMQVLEHPGGVTVPLAMVCGNETILPLLTETNAVTVIFFADGMIRRRGFRIKYEVTQMQTLCGSGQSVCRNRNCFYSTDKCNGIDNCGDATDEEGCGLPPVTTQCGLRKASGVDSVDRVVGGKEAEPGSWPWQADIQLVGYYPNGHSCGGTLINSQWVLTASHCFPFASTPERWRIHLGNHHKFKTDASEQIRYVERIILYPVEAHPGDHPYLHDVALLKLNAPVTFTDQVRPACLPEQGHEVPVGTKCMASGWGMTKGTGSNDVLKETDLTVRQSQICDTDALPIVPETMICVQNERGFSDVCKGDSGGPLVNQINGKWHVVGITSYGTDHSYLHVNCALPGWTSVFAKVSSKTNWIIQQINNNS